eukprot:1466772-Heterocapsa_arctica.AAC.1
MERDVQRDARPSKRRRGQASNMDREETNDEGYVTDGTEGCNVMMEEKNKTWEPHVEVPAIFI